MVNKIDVRNAEQQPALVLQKVPETWPTGREPATDSTLGSAPARRKRAGWEDPPGGSDRQLVGLAWIARRWSCSRQTCRRVLQRAGVRPLFLGGDARNATLRYDLAEVLRVEREAQSPAGSATGRAR